jgi:hypothetical protein
VLDERLRCLLDDGRWPDLASFDPHDDRQFDAVAGRLLERFRRRHDAEAFALLMRLTRGRLLDIATRLLTRQAPDVQPADLVEDLLRRLFNDRARTPVAAGGFFDEARGLMDRHARRLSAHSD